MRPEQRLWRNGLILAALACAGLKSFSLGCPIHWNAPMLLTCAVLMFIGLGMTIKGICKDGMGP